MRVPSKVEPTSVVELHVMVAFELFFLTPRASPGSLREHLERHRERQFVLPQTAHTFQDRDSVHPSPNRSLLSIFLDGEVRFDAARPARRFEPQFLGFDLKLDPAQARGKCCEIDREFGHTKLARSCGTRTDGS